MSPILVAFLSGELVCENMPRFGRKLVPASVDVVIDTGCTGLSTGSSGVLAGRLFLSPEGRVGREEETNASDCLELGAGVNILGLIGVEARGCSTLSAPRYLA